MEAYIFKLLDEFKICKSSDNKEQNDMVKTMLFRE